MGILSVATITQEAFKSLQVKDPDTLYFITLSGDSDLNGLLYKGNKPISGSSVVYVRSASANPTYTYAGETKPYTEDLTDTIQGMNGQVLYVVFLDSSEEVVSIQTWIWDDTKWIKQLSNDGGVVTNYENLDNKPQINGVELEGNKSASNLKLQDKFANLYAEDEYEFLHFDRDIHFAREAVEGYENVNFYTHMLPKFDDVQTRQPLLPTEDKDAVCKKYVDNHHDDTKQDKLTAGTGISINNNIISATGGGGCEITGLSLSGTILTIVTTEQNLTLDLAPIFDTRNFVYYENGQSIYQVGSTLIINSATVTQSDSTLIF